MRRWLFIVFVVFPLTAQVAIRQATDSVAVAIDGKPATAFYYGAGVTKPYVYPLRAASGTAVTRSFPMESRTGDRHDHIHHRGVWFAHSSVNGFDFWNSDPSYHNPKMGRIVVTKIGALQSGANQGSISALLMWQDPSGKPLIEEARTMTFRGGEPRIIDFDITLQAREPIVFGDDKDGVFGLRLAAELEGLIGDSPAAPRRTGIMTGSNGCRLEAQCWGSRGNWIDMSGQLENQTLGVAILDHPENPRHPTYWHSRDYGLLAANVFGVKAFTRDKAADGSLQLESGQKLRFRYRVLVHAGDAKAAHLDAAYAAYR